MAALSPPRVFRRLADRGAFFRGFPFRCVLHLALSLTRSIIVHVATPYSREDPLHECDNLSCLFFAAPWLQQSQSILVQEIQLAKDIDLTCFKTLPIKATTCLQVGPCPWIGQWIQLQDLINPARPPPMRIPTTNIKEALFQLPHTPVGGGMLFNHLRYSMVLQVKIHVATSLMEVCDVLLGTLGVSLGRFFPRRKNRELKLEYFRKRLDNNNILCLQEVHGKDEFLQAIQVLAPRYEFFGTSFPGNENAGGSAICIHKDLLPEDAFVTHMITCQGRDHIVNVQSVRKNSVIVNVHFEPELTLRRFCERLRLITPHWPSYPNALGIILGDFNFCEPEEGRFNVWNQTYTDGDAGKTAMFHSLFSACSRDCST